MDNINSDLFIFFRFLTFLSLLQLL
jgi:hypothetical protein